MSPTTSLVPPRRLGALLRQARVAGGMALDELASQGSLSVVQLDDIEHGRGQLDEATLDDLVHLYGVEDAGLIPERSQLVIDLDEGRIAVNDAGVGVEHLQGPDAILARYLALVYRLRELPVGTAVQLRDVDLGVLSTALEIDSVDVEQRLRRLIEDESRVQEDQRRIRRQLLLPLVGVVVAATSVGTLVLVANPQAPPQPDAVTTVVDAVPRVADAAVMDVVIETDIGNGGAVEENPES